jgi:hypothetical protein
MTVGYVAGSSGLQHDSATRRLDEAQGRQRRLVESLEPWADGEWASTHAHGRRAASGCDRRARLRTS